MCTLVLVYPGWKGTGDWAPLRHQAVLPLQQRSVGMTLGELSVCEDAGLSDWFMRRRIDD